MTEFLDGAGLTVAYQPVVTSTPETSSGTRRSPAGRSRPSRCSTPPAKPAASRTSTGGCATAPWPVASRQGSATASRCSSTSSRTPPPAVPEEHLERVEAATSGLRIVLEVTERAVVQHPAELLRLVDWARQRSWGIALDDIGEDPGSLAMMPFLEPDVIKLDLRLVQQRPTAEIGLIMSAVLAQAERSGAAIVAEGVEDEAMREAALALGATLGQGWMFGRPGALPAHLPTVDTVVPLHRSWALRDDPTPFSIVRSALPVRRASKSQLLSVAAHLEEQAVAWSEGPVVLSTFQTDEQLDALTHERYTTLAGRGSFVAAMRSGGELHVGDGVRTAVLPDGHRLGEEWSVVVVGPHYAGALVSRQVGPDPADGYDYVVTHSRDLVVEAGRSLLRHVVPAGEAPPAVLR